MEEGMTAPRRDMGLWGGGHLVSPLQLQRSLRPSPVEVSQAFDGTWTETALSRMPQDSSAQLALWRRYFRPNEGHMVQGLAPAGCSYLAGKPLDFRQRAQQHMQRPERVDHAQPGIAYRAAVAEDLQYATEWTCVSIACHDFDPQTPFHLLGVGMQATLRMNRGGRPSSIATWPGSITSCSLPR